MCDNDNSESDDSWIDGSESDDSNSDDSDGDKSESDYIEDYYSESDYNESDDSESDDSWIDGSESDDSNSDDSDGDKSESFQIGAGLYAVGRPVQKRNDEDGQIGTIQSLLLERGALFNQSKRPNRQQARTLKQGHQPSHTDTQIWHMERAS